MQRKTLREAREAHGWSQEEFAARFAQIQREAISNWETGKSNPLLRNKQEASEILGWKGSLDELFALVEDEMNTTEEETDKQSISITMPHIVQDFLSAHLINRLWHIAHTSYRAPDDMTAAIQQAIKDSDMMNMGNAPYEITRREALCSLASLPMTTLGQNPRITASHYTQMIMHCTTALEACWQLYRGSDPKGTLYAFDCVCTYVPLLENIADWDGRLRKKALDLAAHYALLQTMLGWEHTTPWEAVIYAQKALALSKETGNILLQLSAYPKLNWSYVRSRQYTRAWQTIQEGEQLLRDYQQAKKRPPLPAGIIGNFYSSYCQAQVKNGMEPDTALGILIDNKPLDGSVAFVQFTAPDQWWEVAWIYNAKGDSTQAMQWLGRLIDLETLDLRHGLQQTESERIGAINILTSALLQSKERNLEKILATWQAGMEGVQVLRHEVMYQEAIANFEIMKALYPGERAILKLTPLTSHWSKQSEFA